MEQAIHDCVTKLFLSTSHSLKKVIKRGCLVLIVAATCTVPVETYFQLMRNIHVTKFKFTKVDNSKVAGWSLYQLLCTVLILHSIIIYM